MSWKDSVREVKSDIHTHELPTVDASFCSCCRKSIISGLHNVVKITKSPETILDENGNKIGTEGHDHVKAYYHATCFQDFHMPSKKVIECKYCKVFAAARTFKNGVMNSCLCSCHKVADFCSMLITSA